MRRTITVLLTAILGIGIVVLGCGALAGAASLHVKPRTKWTLEVPGYGCEVQTIKKGHGFTADLYGDAGTYSGGGSSISETFTAGNDDGNAFVGAWVASSKEYSGSFEAPLFSTSASLVKGVVAGC